MAAFKVVTAFSDNYEVGRLCSKVNRLYCEQQGHAWHEVVLAQEAMLAAVAPRTHCTWYKVHIFLDELQRALGGGMPRTDSQKPDKSPLPALDGSAAVGRPLRENDYLVWVDADAVFVDHAKRLEEIVEEAEEKELVIGEDMHLGNLVNCGVILIKVTPWSLLLWRQVFLCRKYDTVTYFEQSALHKVLKTNREFASFSDKSRVPSQSEPWHSFVSRSEGGDKKENRTEERSVKLFEHSAVFPMHLLNSNICDWDIDALADPDRDSRGQIRQHRKGQHMKYCHQKARFVYHAAGFTRKMSVISKMVKSRLPATDISEFDNLCR